MAIHQPGRRLFRTIPLDFVANRSKRAAFRSRVFSLNLTSMIDFLITVVVFLLMSFQASGECCIERRVDVPKAENTLDMIDAPLVAVADGQVLVDGTAAGSIRDIEDRQQIVRVNEVFDVLRAKRDLWKATNAGRPFPGACVLRIDQDVSALVVKSVFQTTAQAGYPNISFMVDQLPRWAKR